MPPGLNRPQREGLEARGLKIFMRPASALS